VPFTNPLVAGTTLIRTAIHSADYVTGVSGWTINADGSAEFNNVVVRGEVDVTSSSGSSVQIVATPTAAEIELQPPTGSLNYDPATIVTALNGTSPQLRIFGPEIASPVFAVGGSLIFQADQATANSIVTLSGQQLKLGSTATGSLTTIQSKTLDVQGDTTVDGVFTSANRVVGNITITPVASTPTSVTVTFSTPIKAGPNGLTGQVSAQTSVPGTQVTGVSFDLLTTSSVRIWLTRTNTNPTTVSYSFESW
jgi:hypothetical protein